MMTSISILALHHYHLLAQKYVTLYIDYLNNDVKYPEKNWVFDHKQNHANI